jgi:hypothetical protein
VAGRDAGEFLVQDPDVTRAASRALPVQRLTYVVRAADVAEVLSNASAERAGFKHRTRTQDYNTGTQD